MAPLCALVGHAPIVALGEPGHGAHEPLAWRNRLFFYLATHCGFTAIAIETAFSESRAVHDFVLGGPGSAAEVSRRCLSWGFGEYAENAALIQWMRNYNLREAGRRKLQFYGIDLSGADNDSGFPHGGITLVQVMDYLQRAAPLESQNLRVALEPLLQRVWAVGYARLARAHDSGLDIALGSLNAYLAHHAGALHRSSSTSEYDWAVRNLVVARRLSQLFALNGGSLTADMGMGPDEYKEVNARDAAMADNVLWVKRQEGKVGRILVFAHNAHVMDGGLQGGIWAAFKQPPRMMGEHLRAALGESLVIIGTSAAQSGAGLPAGMRLDNDVDDALADVGPSLFVLDLRGAQGLDWMRETHSLRANFSSNLDINLKHAFDALVFIRSVTPARTNPESSRLNVHTDHETYRTWP